MAAARASLALRANDQRPAFSFLVSSPSRRPRSAYLPIPQSHLRSVAASEIPVSRNRHTLHQGFRARARGGHGEVGDGARVPRVQPRRRRRRVRHVVAQPVGVHQRRGVRVLGGAPGGRVPGAAPRHDVGRVQPDGARGGRGRARRRAGRQRPRPPGARRRRRLPPRDGRRARRPARARRDRRPRRADRRHRAHARRRRLLRDPDGERVPARPGEARTEPADRRAGALVPGLRAQHLPGVRACQRPRPAPAEERPDPAPPGEHPLPRRRHRQPPRPPQPRRRLLATGEELGVVLPVREPAVPRRRRAEPAQGVQDAADGRPGHGEAPRRRAGAAGHGEGGQGTVHPGARRPEGGTRPGGRRAGAAAAAAAARVLQGRARQQRQLGIDTKTTPMLRTLLPCKFSGFTNVGWTELFNCDRRGW